jgi:hypothetical protein
MLVVAEEVLIKEALLVQPVRAAAEQQALQHQHQLVLIILDHLEHQDLVEVVEEDQLVEIHHPVTVVSEVLVLSSLDMFHK